MPIFGILFWRYRLEYAAIAILTLAILGGALAMSHSGNWATTGHGKHLGSVPQDFVYPKREVRKRSSEQVTWIGHCTFLIAASGVHILTDPVFGERVSPVPFIGPKRRHPPGVFFDDLPKIDMVLISHNHYDHLEKASVKALHAKNPKTLWVVPKGVGALICQVWAKKSC